MQMKLRGGLLGLIFCAWSVTSAAQSHFKDCVSGTGENATIILPKDNAPRVGEAAINAGDEIAVYSSDGQCVGVKTWENRSTAIVAWGMDQISGGEGGLAPGDRMEFRVWSASNAKEYSSANSSVRTVFSTAKAYLQPDALYRPDGIYVVDHLGFQEKKPAQTDIISSSNQEG